jgi:hypothetical protein
MKRELEATSEFRVESESESACFFRKTVLTMEQPKTAHDLPIQGSRLRSQDDMPQCLRWLQELESRAAAAPVCWDNNGDHWHTVLETQGNSSARPCRSDEAKAAAANFNNKFLKKEKL